MKLIGVGVLVTAVFSAAAPAAVSAQDLYRPLTGAERRAFEACLHTIWVNDYCGATNFVVPWAASQIRACVVANSGDTFPVQSPRPWNPQDYCRAAVENGVR